MSGYPVLRAFIRCGEALRRLPRWVLVPLFLGAALLFFWLGWTLQLPTYRTKSAALTVFVLAPMSMAVPLALIFAAGLRDRRRSRRDDDIGGVVPALEPSQRGDGDVTGPVDPAAP